MSEVLRTKLEKICVDYPGIKIEFTYQQWQTDFLRFFQSQTNYNITKEDVGLGVTIHKDKKSYSFNIPSLEEEEIRTAIDQNIPILEKLPPDNDFVDIENNLEIAPDKNKQNNINEVSLEKKVAILEKISQAVAPYQFKIYGTFICNYITTYIITSNKLNKKMVNSPIYLEVKAVSDINQVTILETFGGENFVSFTGEEFMKSIVRKVEIAGHETIDVEPGDYEVILAPRCIGEYFSYLGWVGFGARSYDQKQSCFQESMNKQIFPESISLTDNPENPNLISFEYNGNGHIYKPLKLIEKGVFKNFYVDNYYSYKTGLTKNGNSGECLELAPGDGNLEDMIGKIKKGLYISSLHYMNFINHKETSLTGLTRDGTFLIEDGKLTKVVNNLRFTEKILDIISNIVELENKLYTIPFSENYSTFSIYSVSMPHVRVKEFYISSSTRTI